MGKLAIVDGLLGNNKKRCCEIHSTFFYLGKFDLDAEWTNRAEGNPKLYAVQREVRFVHNLWAICAKSKAD